MDEKTYITCPDTNTLSLISRCYRCRKLIQVNYGSRSVECIEKHGKPYRHTHMVSEEDVE